MKTNSLRVAFVFFYLALIAYGQNAKISVCVINDVDKPEGGLVIIADDKKYTTDEKGEFSIDLPYQSPGSPVIISIDRPGWSILKPFMGRTATINALTNGECNLVTIAPKRSPRFLDADSLSSLTGKLQTTGTFSVDLSTSIRREAKAVRNLERDELLQAYGKWSGFDVSEIEAALSERQKGTFVTETLREADQAWREGDHSRAVLLYLKIGNDDTLLVGNDVEGRRIKVTALMRAGTVSFEDYKFKDALAAFEALEKRYFDAGKISKDTFKAEWLDLEYYLGRTKVQLSSEAKWDEATTLLNDAIRSYKQALDSLTRQEFPDNQAKLQYGLGTALLELGRGRLNLSETLVSLNQAVEALNSAAQSAERLNKTGTSSLDLLRLQISIGEAWFALGTKTGGRESMGYLSKSLVVFDQANNALTREALVNDKDKRAYADLNHNLGLLRLNLFDRTVDPTRKVNDAKKAVTAFQEASTTYTRLLNSNQAACVSCVARSLIDLAISWDRLRLQSNLATERATYRKNTLVTFEQADKAINRIKPDEEPLSWAALKQALGHAFSELARRTNDPAEIGEYFERAIKAHDEGYALESRGYCPPCALQSLMEVGTVWSMLGQTTRDPVKSSVYFGNASDVFDRADKAMSEIKQNGVVLAWPGVKVNLGYGFANLAGLAGRAGDQARSSEYINKADKAYQEAYALIKLSDCPACTFNLFINLGNAWNALERMARSPVQAAEYRQKTLAAFDRADQAIDRLKREQEPISWAASKANLGLAFSQLATGVSDPALSVAYFKKAAAAFDAAAAVYNGLDGASDYCASCAVHSLLDLADAWDVLAGRVTNADERTLYSNKASDAYDQADNVISSIKRNEDKFIWAGLKTDLGQVFVDLASRANTPTRNAKLLSRAAVAYDEAAKVYDGADPSEDYCTPCATSTLLSLGRAWYTLGEKMGDDGAEYRNKALAVFDKAGKTINRIKREDEPFTWSRLTANLGDAFSDLAERTPDPSKASEYLGRAATAYEEEASGYALLLANREYCSPCVTSALTSLGRAWDALGERAANEAKAIEYFAKSVDAFDKASIGIRHDDKQDWADLNIDKGRSLISLASRTNYGPKKADYIEKASTAYEEAASAFAILFGGQNYCSPCAAHAMIGLGTAWRVLGQITPDATKSVLYYDKALAAFDKVRIAINLMKTEKDVVTQAELNGDLGDALSELAYETSDPARKAQYLNKAAAAFAEEWSSYATLLMSQDSCSSCLTAALSDLGTSWNRLGERSADQSKSIEYFGNAVEMLLKAENNARRDNDKRVWANLHDELGHALSDLAYETSDLTQKAEYLNKGAVAYDEAAGAFRLLYGSQDHCSSCLAHALIDLGTDWSKLAQTSSNPAKADEYRHNATATLDQASKAFNSVNRADDPFTWAGLNGDIGDAYSVLADQAPDSTENAQYLNKGAAAFEEEAKAYATLLAKKDYCASCLTSALTGLAGAWNLLGERADAPATAEEFFGKAVAVFDIASHTIKRDEEKLAWADLNVKLGRSFSNLGYSATDPAKRKDYFEKTILVYEEARKIYTLQANPQEWADVTVYLAQTYSALEKWDAVVEWSNRVLQEFPDDQRAYTEMAGALHDGLFEFGSALEFKKKWVEHHPADLSAQSDLAENYFTTAEFEQSIKLVNILLNNSEIKVADKMALRAIEIGCLLATDQSQAASVKFDTLTEEVRKQPANFSVTWIFRGSHRFVADYPKLAQHREWLEKLFDTLENSDHDMLTRGLTDLAKKFREQN
jgi:hypothetical protein